MKKKLTLKETEVIFRDMQLTEHEKSCFNGGGDGSYDTPYELEEFLAALDNPFFTPPCYYYDAMGELSYCNVRPAVVYPDNYAGYSDSSYTGTTGGYNSYSSYSEYSGGSYTSDDSRNFVDAMSIVTSIKEAIMNIAEKGGEIEPTGKTYIRINKAVGKALGGIGIGIAFSDLIDNPTLENSIKVAVSISALGLGPWGSIGYAILDLSGGVDYITGEITKKIEELTQ